MAKRAASAPPEQADNGPPAKAAPKRARTNPPADSVDTGSLDWTQTDNASFWLALKKNIDSVLADSTYVNLKTQTPLGIGSGGSAHAFNVDDVIVALTHEPYQYTCSANIRPWDCDDYLAGCKSNFIDGKNAFTKAIQFSPILKKWFTEANARSNVRTSISNHIADFAWAKQRYDGITTPLGRFVIYIEGLIATANLAIGIRKDAAAIEFVSNLDAESYLQMAMMADATDELSRSVHAFDGNMLDEADTMIEARTIFSHPNLLPHIL